MANWKKVLLSGSAASLSSLTLDSALTIANGGTGLATSAYSNGDILYYNGSVSTTQFQVLSATGQNSKVLKIVNGLPTYQVDDAGGVGSVTSDNTGVLTATTVGSTVTLSAITGSIASGNNNLVSGGTLYTYYQSQFSNNLGTVTQVANTTTNTDINGLKLTGTTINAGNPSGTITLTGTLSGIAKNQLAQNDITIGTTTIDLGATSATLAGLQGIGFAAGNASIGNGLGAYELIVADSTSTVSIPGNLIVQGTASFTDADTLQVEDKIILLNSGSQAAAAGGFIVQQGTPDQGQFFGFDNNIGTGRWGFKAAQSDGSTPSIDHYATIIQRGAYNFVGSSVAAPTYGGSSGWGNIAIDTGASNDADSVYMYL
jgi:hypothetical protein